ncbi:MAG: hypothetical protein ACRD30_00215, partial [Bryobacteraceae bacterium]
TMLAAVAAIGIAVVAIHRPRPKAEPVTQAAASRPAEVPSAQPGRKIAPKPKRHEEIVTQFFPLLEPAPPLGNGVMVRVILPASAMRTVGLPVREDRLSEPVQADVLVSEDGLAEAIRFVNISERR